MLSHSYLYVVRMNKTHYELNESLNGKSSNNKTIYSSKLAMPEIGTAVWCRRGGNIGGGVSRVETGFGNDRWGGQMFSILEIEK